MLYPFFGTEPEREIEDLWTATAASYDDVGHQMNSLLFFCSFFRLQRSLPGMTVLDVTTESFLLSFVLSGERPLCRDGQLAYAVKLLYRHRPSFSASTKKRKGNKEVQIGRFFLTEAFAFEGEKERQGTTLILGSTLQKALNSR